jgi:hypothetical protein
MHRLGTSFSPARNGRLRIHFQLHCLSNLNALIALRQATQCGSGTAAWKNSDDLPSPDVLAQEIADDLQIALERSGGALRRRHCEGGIRSGRDY